MSRLLERTAENHVQHILTRLGSPHEAGSPRGACAPATSTSMS